ncbi:MAG: hypothetical protein ACYCXG_11235 [Acidiferrobacter sp.]
MKSRFGDLGRRSSSAPQAAGTSRSGLSWTLGAVATFILIGGAMAMGFFDHDILTPVPAGAGADRVVLTADTAPPALWSNTWLGRAPYRAIAFNGLSRFATGFSLRPPHKASAFGRDLMHWAPRVSTRLVRWRHDIAVFSRQTLIERAWL